MRRLLLWLGPALILASCAVAFAQDGSGLPAAPGGSAPSLDYLLSLGPYGALVWGAYLLGKGVKVTVQVELSERDRDLVAMLGTAETGAAPRSAGDPRGVRDR